MTHEGSTGATTRPRRRRRGATVAAVVLLLIGVGLLAFSALWLTGRSNEPASGAAQPSRTTTRSPVAVAPTFAGSPSASPGSPGSTPTPVISYVAVPTFVPVPVPSSQEQGLLPLITTISGLLASVAGIVSAIVSVRGARAR